MKPEEKARQQIDRQLSQAGWIQDHREMNLSVGPGVAVREFPLKTGEADYLLYVAGKVAGDIEAKPVGHTLRGVEIQSAKYTAGLPDVIPHYRLPPFAYETTGEEARFTNSLEPDFRRSSRHSPCAVECHSAPEPLRTALGECLLRPGDGQLRARLRGLRASPGGATSIRMARRHHIA